MSELNPVTVEKTILEIVNDISQAILQGRDALAASLAANRAYDLAYARAYMAYEGAAHAKKYAAEIATAQERIDRDAADVAFRFVDKSARALEKKLDAYRSLGAFVRQAYAEAGRGEW